MSDSVEKTPEARWRHLRETGHRAPVDLSSNDLISERPKWFDETKWMLARETIEKYHIGVKYSSLSGLLLILQIPDGLEPLLSTGNSKDIPSLFRRYVSTMLHVRSWYQDDIFDPETKGYRSIRQVRAMHKRVQHRLNETLKVSGQDGQERLWLNQYDVCMTQFAFVGLAMIYPEKSAMIAATPDELELVNYYWRVLGYLMGVKDEYNACQFDKYEDIKEFFTLMLEKEYKENFNTLPCETGLMMSKGICLALQYFTPMVTFNSLAHWWADCFHFNGYKPQPMTMKERLFLLWTKLTFGRLFKNEGFLKFATKFYKKKFDARLKNKDKVYEDLKKQYENDQEYTFYSDRVEYFARNKGPHNETSQQVDPSKASEAIRKLQGVCPFGYEALPIQRETAVTA